MNLFNNFKNTKEHQEINLKAKNGILYGNLYSGNAFNKEQPLVIYSHGLGDYQGSGNAYIKALTNAGYSVYAFDFNHGTFSDDMTKMSIFTEEDDLQTVVNYFKDKGYQHIFLLGASQGGVVSAMVAADRNDIEGLILFYPAFVLRNQMLEMFPNSTFPETFNLMGITLGKEYLKDLPNYDLLNEVTRYSGPVLIVHGTRDNIAPISYSEDIAYKNKTLIKIPGAGHVFYGISDRKAIKYLLEFMSRNF